MTAPFTAAELIRLLGRPARAAVGPEERRAFAGRRVIVTGAAGSIGSELARELAASQPALLALVDHSELGLFTIERELQARWPHVRVSAHLVDVTRAVAMRRVCRAVQPDVVYHAAAYKHVTMAERAVAAAARVNVLGSVNAARAAQGAGARFVLISSDKAADPRSVMGATKRLAEVLTLAAASPRFRPIVVRFGNVLGSSGSVLPLMRQAIRAGEPIRITDPDATRYFMTAGEAVALVFRADLIARAAEVFWLDMGDPVRIGDLAERVIALERDAGYVSAGVQVVGLRAGEKRTETLADPQLIFQRTIDERIRVARDAVRPETAAVHLRRLSAAVQRENDRAVLDVLIDATPGFVPSGQALGTPIAGMHKVRKVREVRRVRDARKVA